MPYPRQVLDVLSQPAHRSQSPVRRLIGTGFRLWYQLHQLLRESIKFATVGSVGFVVDVVLFNTLLYGAGPLQGNPLGAKTASVLVATIVTFAGNRHWTFRHRSRPGLAREYPMFFFLNGVGLGIALLSLWVSHYVMGFTSPLADNIAANVVGLGLGTLFRFWSYRTFVFPEPPPVLPPDPARQLVHY